MGRNPTQAEGILIVDLSLNNTPTPFVFFSRSDIVRTPRPKSCFAHTKRLKNTHLRKNIQWLLAYPLHNFPEQEKPEIVDLELALPDVTITWVSTPASSYDIESTGVLTNGASWAALVQNVVATQTNTSFTANGVSDDALHFRVIPSP